MKLFLLGIVCMPLLSYAQADSSKDIKWVTGLAWEQVIQKASQENKYVFVDCYTTWCMPCKLMDKQVYTNDSISGFVNEHFIAVKVEMDTSKWKPELQISAYPSYVFFSPGGELVHREIGFHRVEDFLAILRSSMDTGRQYYRLCNRFQDGDLDFCKMPYLALLAKRLKNGELSAKVANDYINNYLFTLDRKGLYTKRNIEFISQFLGSPDKKAFYLFYDRGRVVDSLMGRGFSSRLVDYVIDRSEISRFLEASVQAKTEPDWAAIEKPISERFGAVDARRNILTAKVRWYDYTHQWEKYNESLIARVNSFGAFGIGIPDFDLNNHAWSIFLHSHRRNELEIALRWSDSAIKLNPKYSNSYDTNANLLYELGKTSAAISMEEKAISIEPKQEYKDVLEKIKHDVPTWSAR